MGPRPPRRRVDLVAFSAMRTGRNPWLIRAFALALVLRLAAAVSHIQDRGTIHNDEEPYQQLGEMLGRTGTFRYSPDVDPEIIRGPVYPAFVALFVRLFDSSRAAPLVAQALLGACLAVLLARQLGRAVRENGADEALSRRAESIAALALAVSPFALLYERALLSEGLCAFLLALAVVAWMRARSPGTGWAFAVGGGAILGLAMLAKPACLFVPAALAAAELVAHGRSVPWRRLVVFAVTAYAVVLPWTVRNHRLTGRVIPVGIGGGAFLYLGTMPADAAGLPIVDADELQKFEHYLDRATPLQERIRADRAMGAEALARIGRDPVAYIALCARRAVRLWLTSHASMFPGGDLPRAAKGALAAFAGLLWGAGAYGLWRVSPSVRRSLLPMAALPVYFTLVHMPIVSGGRYAVPAWPFVLTLASLAPALWLGRDRAAPASRAA
jgi:4-amino-4-deoxy-L-arabinose transferase-like glycosyltransferase